MCKMSSSTISILACVGSLLLVLSTQAAFSSEKLSVEQPTVTVKASKELSLAQLRDRARAITVKVIAGRGWGSGILIKKQGQVYTILTNAHVLRIGDRYQIQTADGKVHFAQPSDANQFQDDDLALLSFRSSNNYAIATIAKSRVAIGDETFAAGFPDEEEGFAFTNGKVDYSLAKPFRGGYQIGYSNDILKGMSGGPVINRGGELVAINGRHKHPIWGNSFIFQDGSTPLQQIRQQMENSSWAVPVERFLQLAPQFANRMVTVPIQRRLPIIPNPESVEVEPIYRTNINNKQPRSQSSFW